MRPNNVEVLNNLIRVLEDVKATDKKFDMANWAIKNKCGTVCCALGWAAFDSWFNKQGLNFYLNEASDRIYHMPIYYDGRHNCHPTYLFNIGHKFDQIFYADSYNEENVTPDIVIERVKNIISELENKNAN